MSARNTDGWVKVHRVLTAHNLWTSEPFTRGQAWVDLLMLANHAPGIVRKQGLRIDLDRGDVGWSEIELSARWKWSRGKVRRFLDELLADNMIVRKNNTNFGQKTVQADGHKQDKRKFVISIVNYDKFQDSQTSDETSDGTGDETGDGQATDKRRYKNKNDKNDKNNNIPHGDADAVGEKYITKKKRVLTGKRLETFNRFWTAFSYPKGKAEAADAWLDIPSLTDSLVEVIVSAAKREAKNRPQLVAGGRTPKWAQGWITARRWEDEAEPLPTARPTLDMAAIRAMVAVN